MSQILNDFQKQDIKFDINKLRNACDEILNIKGFDTSLGIPHFASISLNQIPEDSESISGDTFSRLTQYSNKGVEFSIESSNDS